MHKQPFSEEVNHLLVKLPPEFQEMINALRHLVLSCDSSIAEHVKWNSPAFYYNGPMADFDPKTYARDLMVLHLRKGFILIVMPTGAKLRANTSILEGDYTDGRRMITLKTLEEIRSKWDALKAVITEWLSLIER